MFINYKIYFSFKLLNKINRGSSKPRFKLIFSLRMISDNLRKSFSFELIGSR